MAHKMHPRLIADQHLLPDEVMECECECVIVSTDTLQLRKNFEECVFNQSTKSTLKKGRNPCHVDEWSSSSHSYVTPGKEPLYLLNRRMGWSQIRSEHFGEGKNLSPARNQTLDHPAYIKVTVLTTLFQLSSSNICNCRLLGNIEFS
jgi:hypothetical protein